MTRLLLFASSVFISVSVHGQGKLTYEGPFENGEATYEYTENNLHEKIFNGRFNYTQTRHIEERGGDHVILITGNFKEDKKHLAWAVTVKPVEGAEGLTETVIGNYIDGEKSGLWTHRVVNAEGQEIRLVKASFIKNHFRGPFSYRFTDSTAVGISSMQIQGKFENDGKLDGPWTISYTDGTGQTFNDSIVYMHGVQAFRHQVNATTSEVLKTEDNVTFVSAFFQGMDKADSFAVVEGEKYGLRQTQTDHRILKPVLTSWMNLAVNEVSNTYDAPLPTVYYKRGEIRNPKLLRNRMNIIPWKETPQGKKEYEEKLAIQRAYDTKINVADLQFKEENYRQAVKLYKEAYAIKAEPYAKDQQAKAEEFIRIEEEKKRIVTLLKNREDLWQGNNSMLKVETYYGKKKKLYEASLLGIEHLKKELYSTYRETRTAMSQQAIEKLSLEDLNAYRDALDEAIAFQDRLKAVSKREDTKDLEKELKKMEDPRAIVERILQE